MSIRDDLKAYVDGELSPERAAEVRAAVEADPALLQEVEFMKALGFEIKRLSVEPQPQGYEETMKAVGRKRKIWWSPLNLSVAAVAVLFVVGGYSVLWPVFAQSKDSAKMSLARYESGRTQAGEFNDNDGTAAPSTPPAATLPAPEMQMEKGADNYGVNGAVPADESPAPAEHGGGGLGSAPMAMSGKRDFAKKSADGGVRIREEGKLKTAAPQPGGVPTPSTIRDRMVVQNAQMDVKVPDAKKALNDATGMAQGLGGFVESSGISGSQGGLPTASATLRVPQPKFAVAMQRLRDMGEVLDETTSGEDVTGQYADVDARLKVLRQEEEQYRTILGQTKRISDILEVKDRLGQVRQQIESLDAQRVALKDQAKLSTIQVTFQQAVALGKPEAPKNWLEDVWATSVNGLSAVGVFLAKVGVFLFVFSPIWLTVVGVAWWLKVRANRAG